MLSSKKPTYADDALLVCLAVMAAIGILSFRLSWQGYWWDEDVTLMFVREDWRTLLVEYWGFDTHRPVYYGLQKAWVSVFGESVVAVRSLPVALSLPIIPLFFAIAKRLPASSAPVITLILLISFPIFVHHAREIRMYGLFHLFMAVSLWLMVLLIEAKGRRGMLWLAFAITMAAGFYAHPIAILVAVLYGVWCCLCVLQRTLPLRFLLEAIAAFGVFLLLILPALTPFFGHMVNTLDGGWWIPHPSNTSHLYYQTIAAYDYPGILRLPILALLLWGMYKLPKDQPLSWLLIILMIGMPLIILATSFFRPIYLTRTIAWGSMAGLLILAYGISAIRIAWLRWSFVVMVLLMQAVWLNDYYPKKPDFPFAAFEERFDNFDPETDTFILGHQWEEPELRWVAPHLFEGAVYGLAWGDGQQGFVDPAYKSAFFKRADVNQISLGDGRLFVLAETAMRSPELSVEPALRTLTEGRVLESSMVANGFRLEIFKAR